MDKKTILALIIVGAIFLLWPVYMRKIVGKNAPVTRSVSQGENQESVERPVSQSYNAASSENNSQDNRKEKVPDSRSLSVPGVKPDTVVVETGLFKGKLSSLGGGTVISWKLKQFYKPYTDKDREGKSEESWVELIPEGAEGDLGLILGMDLSRKVFAVEYDTLGAVKKYRFVYTFANGSKAEKEFQVIPDSYSMYMAVRLTSMTRGEVGEGYSIQWKSGLLPTEGEKQIRDDLTYYKAWALYGQKPLKTGKNTIRQEGDTKWVAVRTKYFVMALIPVGSQGREFEIVQNDTSLYKDKNWKTFTARLGMPFGGSFEETNTYKLYLGPMDYSLLKKQGSDLQKIMFGRSILTPISIAFFYVLQFLYGILKNYGWAIILFSILIKVVLYPLTRKSFQSMRQMQELQPKIAALKEKFKNDSQRLNQETMKLYKQHGVNPMGGCLPMVFQMPVLIALFTLFRTTIMLRQASFLAIRDLSAPDGIFGTGLNLLPILMGISMIVQQKLSTSNPQQKAMAYMMPIFLCFIFYRMSAGLNLYYLMFNVLTIAQELLIKKHK
jgi:YidC/Oxa1 family membrane protein insertase